MRFPWQWLGRGAVFLLTIAFMHISGGVAQQADGQKAVVQKKAVALKRGPSGLALPRFVSMKSNPVNLRKGPGTEYPKAWIFRRAGLPVEVIQEYNHWRRVRDSEGASGWVLYSLLSGRRTALILPWEVKNGVRAPLTDLRSSARLSSLAVARLEAGTLIAIKSCTKAWCYVSAGAYRGYVQKHLLWGVYPNETVP